MPFNGSGSFSPPGADFPAVANTLIESTKFNNVINDIATGLSTCITKDGQTTVTANIPFGGYRLTGVGAGTASTDAARVGQLQNGAGVTLGTIAGTNTITAVGSPVITAYAANQFFRFIPAATNTGATTINIDALGAKNIFSNGAACVGGELVIGVPVGIFYDGTQFNVMGAALVSSTTFTLTGCTTAPTYAGKWTKRDNVVTLSFPALFASGTSNATTKTLTGMPASIRPSGAINFSGFASDNGGAAVAARMVIASDGVITMYANAAAAAWTNSGTMSFEFPSMSWTTA